MIIVDNLTIQTLLIIVKKLNKREIIDKKKIIVLDYFKPNLKNKIFKFFFSILKISIEEENFIIGNSYTKEKKNVFLRSREIMDEISINMSREALNKNHLINQMNDYWKNNTILLFLSKFFYEMVEFEEHLIPKLFVCKFIRDKNKDKSIDIIFNRPDYFNEKYLPPELRFKKIIWYKRNEVNFKKSKLFIIVYILFYTLNALWRDFICLFKKKTKFTNPTISLIQEDNISLDRSLRTQPHWLFKNKNIENLNVVIFSDEKFHDKKLKDFNSNNIFIVNPKKIKSLKMTSDCHKKILLDIKSLLLNRNNSFNYILTKLLLDYYFYSSYCKDVNIKGFMTAENYMPISTVMSMMSSKNLLKSFSYQYSNMGRVSPIMLTTSDVMFTFSNTFQERWSKYNIKPKKFKNVGYVYSSSFPLVKSKINYYKDKFKKKKNDIYITLFDESFQNNKDKFGFFTKDKFCEEIKKIVNYASQNKSITIITKSKFSKNSAQKLCKNNELENLIKNNRWLEISAGSPRNIVLPCEATILSDIVIGHAVGGTSSLEAALFGKKAILINPYNLEDPNIKLYQDCNILFKNLDEAINAISEYRSGNPKYFDLGNWEKILHHFVSYRDSNAAERIYNYILEELK